LVRGDEPDLYATTSSLCLSCSVNAAMAQSKETMWSSLCIATESLEAAALNNWC
jgi:hypothetical protein